MLCLFGLLYRQRSVCARTAQSQKLVGTALIFAPFQRPSPAGHPLSLYSEPASQCRNARLDCRADKKSIEQILFSLAIGYVISHASTHWLCRSCGCCPHCTLDRVDSDSSCRNCSNTCARRHALRKSLLSAGRRRRARQRPHRSAGINRTAQQFRIFRPKHGLRLFLGPALRHVQGSKSR